MSVGPDNGQTINFAPTLTRQDAVEFLRKAARDDDFRSELKADPVGAFASLGIQISEGLIPEGGIVLPPKHHLEDLLYYLASGDEFGNAVGELRLGLIIYVVVFAFSSSP